MISLENNSSKAQPITIQHSFQPIYYISRCVGLWLFTIIFDSNGSIEETRVHLFDKLWVLVSICLYWIALFYTYEGVKNDNNNLVVYLIQTPTLLFAPIGIALDMCNRKSLVDILANFIIFDSEVRLNFLMQ